jgi:hypothetical protein
MDALTFLLDTVTPFWRTYGKTIGQDVQDFFIIPLYRNEFTGEPKRYKIEHIPSRSLRHWIALTLMFWGSVLLLMLQTRAAATSTTNYALTWITYDKVRWTALPFFWIGIAIQWGAVISEFIIVLMEVGVLIWWAGWFLSIFT